MNTLTRIATWVERVAIAVIGQVVRGTAALLTVVLRRGKHRAWRRGAAKAKKQRSSAPRN
jgi:hypothetical protein